MATRADLRAAVRLRADAVNWGGVTDANLDSWLEDSHRELHDLVTLAHPDTYTKIDTDKTIDAAGNIPLPSDFYKVRAVSWVASANHLVPVPRFNFAERDRQSFAYHDLGSAVTFSSLPYVVGKVVRLYYVPKPVLLADDGTVLDLVLDQYREYMVTEVAAKVFEKQEEWEIADRLRMRKADIEKKLRAMIPRDVGTGEQIASVWGRRRRLGDPGYYLP